MLPCWYVNASRLQASMSPIKAHASKPFHTLLVVTQDNMLRVHTLAASLLLLLTLTIAVLGAPVAGEAKSSLQNFQDCPLSIANKGTLPFVMMPSK